MTDKPRRSELAPPLDHELDATPGEWKWRCASCGKQTAENPSGVCTDCKGEMQRITDEGGTVEEYR